MYLLQIIYLLILYINALFDHLLILYKLSIYNLIVLLINLFNNLVKFNLFSTFELCFILSIIKVLKS